MPEPQQPQFFSSNGGGGRSVSIGPAAPLMEDKEADQIIITEGFLDLRIIPWVRNLLTRSLAIVPSLVVSIIGGSAGAGQMILSFELPFALIPLLQLTSSETKMGNNANSIMITVITWILSILIMAINTYFLVTRFLNALSGLQTVSKVLAGIFGFAGMAAYPVAILYLVFRKNRKTTQLLLLHDAELGVQGDVS